jgi:protein tyrosine phosphatase (PTP) superfamily phosphohydrolase (DUF442 family)
MGSGTHADPVPVTPVKPAPGDAHAAPIHQYKRLSDRLVMGASPETDEDFAFLAAQGVKTIVSVDGARPHADAAAKHGLRYVHIPIGYDGIPRDKQVALAKAFTEIPGTFYVHCHHGKHRGPAACMVGRLLLDKISVEEAVAELKAQGTDPRYRGLYAVPGQFKPPTAEELAAAPPLVSVAAVVGMQAVMVEVDEAWERMKEVKKAGWLAPKDHPDIDPEHEARILAERFRELARTDDVAKRDEAFRRILKASEDAAWDLSAALKPGSLDRKRAAEAFDAGSSSCAKCHTAYRDNK